MSEHREFLPPSPIAFPKEDQEIPLTKQNLKLNELSLDTSDLPTPPPVPGVSKKMDSVPDSVKEVFSFDESQRLLEEVHESEKLLNETQEELRNEIVSDENNENNEENQVVEDLTKLATLVALLLSQDDRMKKYNIPVSHDVKVILFELLNVDNYFDNVENIMKDIVHDDKIDAKDVPKIMLLLTELYKMLKDVKNIKFDEKLCGEVLKTLFNIAMKEGLITIHKEDIELLKCLYEIVDTSISLMQTDTSGEKKGIIYYVKKLFNGCK